MHALRDLRWEDLTITQQAGGTLVSWDDGSVLLEGMLVDGPQFVPEDISTVESYYIFAA